MNRAPAQDVYLYMLKLQHAVYILGASLLLAACAPSAQQQADYSAVERSGVTPAIYDKMIHDDPLSLTDIVALNHARVNDGIVVRYIRDHGTVYPLSRDDINYLQSNGVSPSVIDFMVQTSGPGPGPYGAPGPFYVGPPISIGIGVGGGGYHHW
jgi:hypothetical protein